MTPVPNHSNTLPAQIDNSDSLIHPNYKSGFYKGLTVSSLSTISLFLFPIESINIIAATTLIGIAHKTIEVMLSSRNFVEYYTATNQWEGVDLKKRIVRSLNPVMNAIILGIMHYKIPLTVGCALAALARMPFWYLPIKISASQIYVYVGAISVISFVYSQIKGVLAQRKLSKDPYESLGDSAAFETLDKIPETDSQHKWAACSAIEEGSGKVFAFGNLILSISIIAARAGLFVL